MISPAAPQPQERHEGCVWAAAYDQAATQASALQAEVRQERAIVARLEAAGISLLKERDRVRAVAVEAIGLLLKLGFWGLDRTKEAEVHATALGLRARLATVDQTGPETGLSATQGGQDGETVGTDGAEVQDGREALDAAMSAIWLHGNWRWLTRNMTTAGQNPLSTDPTLADARRREAVRVPMPEAAQRGNRGGDSVSGEYATETIRGWSLAPGHMILVPMTEAIETVLSTDHNSGYVTVKTAEGSTFQWLREIEVNVMAQ